MLAHGSHWVLGIIAIILTQLIKILKGFSRANLTPHDFSITC